MAVKTPSPKKPGADSAATTVAAGLKRFKASGDNDRLMDSIIDELAHFVSENSSGALPESITPGAKKPDGASQNALASLELYNDENHERKIQLMEGLVAVRDGNSLSHVIMKSASDVKLFTAALSRENADCKIAKDLAALHQQFVECGLSSAGRRPAAAPTR